MTALGTNEILARLNEPILEKRLVITPILDPETQLKKGDVSVDVRLGRAFSLLRPWSHSGMEDVSNGGLLQRPSVEEIVLDYGQPFVLHPHQFVLARTLEVVRLPDDLMAYVVGRSSWGRRGLTVATATVVHPGFYGPITLELKNVGEVPLSLYTFDRVAQLVFHSVPSASASASTASVTPSAPPETSAEVRPESPPAAEHGMHLTVQPISDSEQVGRTRQFPFGFVPGLGQVRDEATLKRISSLAEKRREATRTSKEPPPLVPINAEAAKPTPS